MGAFLNKSIENRRVYNSLSFRKPLNIELSKDRSVSPVKSIVKNMHLNSRESMKPRSSPYHDHNSMKKLVILKPTFLRPLIDLPGVWESRNINSGSKGRLYYLNNDRNAKMGNSYGEDRPSNHQLKVADSELNRTLNNNTVLSSSINASLKNSKLRIKRSVEAGGFKKMLKRDLRLLQQRL